MCYDVQNFDLSKGKSSFLELFHVIFILFTITKILYYHQGIFLYIEAYVKTKKLKNQNYFKRPSQQLCYGRTSHFKSNSGIYISNCLGLLIPFLPIWIRFISFSENDRTFSINFKHKKSQWK